MSAVDFATLLREQADHLELGLSLPLDTKDAARNLIALSRQAADTLAAAEAALAEMRAELERASDALELAMLWLANSLPVVDIPGPKPLPVIEAFLAARAQAKPTDDLSGVGK